MNPSTSEVARKRLSMKRMTPDIVAPESMSRVALVIATPGMRSMITPMMTMSILIAGMGFEAKQIRIPKINDVRKSKTIALGVSF